MGPHKMLGPRASDVILGWAQKFPIGPHPDPYKNTLINYLRVCVYNNNNNLFSAWRWRSPCAINYNDNIYIYIFMILYNFVYNIYVSSSSFYVRALDNC